MFRHHLIDIPLRHIQYLNLDTIITNELLNALKVLFSCRFLTQLIPRLRQEPNNPPAYISVEQRITTYQLTCSTVLPFATQPTTPKLDAPDPAA